MKNVFLLSLVLAISFWSCSSDDDNKQTNDAHPIVGTWKLVSFSDSDGNYYPNDCEVKSRETYETNGDLLQKIYGYDSAGNCISEQMDIHWELLGNGNMIKIIHEADYDETTWYMNFSNNNKNVEFVSATNNIEKIRYEKVQ